MKCPPALLKRRKFNVLRTYYQLVLKLMTLALINFVGIWPGFDPSQNSVGLRGSDDPEGVTAPQVFQVMMKFFVCFCLQIFDECLSRIESWTDIQLKALSFSVQISNVLEGDQMVSTWPRFSGLEWRLHRCSLHAFWKVYFFMKKKKS